MSQIIIIVDVSQAIGYLNALPTRLNLSLEDGLSELAEFAELTMMREAPFRTGELMLSVTKERTGPLEYTIYPKAKHGIFVERGTRPHIIRPLTARALHFFTDRGEEVFTTLVRHPGTKPNPFVARTREQVKQRVLPVMQKKVMAAVM